MLLSEEKTIVLETAKSYGETFDFLNKKVIFEKFDDILKMWENKIEVRKFIEEIYYSLWEK